MSAALKSKPGKAQADTSSPARAQAKSRAADVQLDYSGKDWRASETADVYDFYEEQSELTLFEALERLRRAATLAPERALPQQEKLEDHFDKSLSRFTAVWSAEIRSILAQLKVKAAVIGDCMVLPEEGVSFETLLHETTHLLQTIRRASGTGPAPDEQANTDDIAAAESEAEHMEAHEGHAQTEQSRPEGAVLFREGQAQQEETSDWEASQDYRAAARARQEPANDSSDGPTANDNQEDVISSQQSASPDGEVSTEAGLDAVSGDLALDPAPPLESAVPDLGEDVAAAEAALAASIAQLDAATTPEAYTEAFQLAPPSVKAQRYDGYQARLDELAASETEGFNETLPEPSANMSGSEAELTAVDSVTAPGTEIAPLEAGTPAPTPDPVIAPTAQAVPYTANADAANALPATAEELAAEQVARAIAGFSTTDNDVDTSAGAPPSVPLEGEADPERLAEQSTAAADQAGTRRDEAMSSVIDGPGPEQVQLREMSEAVPLTLNETAIASAPIEAVGGAEEFKEHALDAETQALFDQAHGDPMQASLNDAQSQAASMAEERDSRREESVGQATAELDAAETEANSAQREQVQSSREQIQNERQSTLEAQGQAVADLDAEVAAENTRVRGQVDERVAADEAQVAQDFTAAESAAQTRVAEGEQQAESERDAADREAEDQSWWDRAVNFVKSQLAKLTEAIGAIFDAVREGVTFILDKAKEAAFALIDAAASFVKDAITAYGEFLKAGVNLLIGTAFPGLAAELNAAIDQGVALAHEAVDAAAENLKAAVNAIVDKLNEAINAVLSFVEGALNTIVAVVTAAITGDWGEVARLILEPVLRALGIEPAEFYTYIGNFMDSLGNIIAHPIDFLGNLFSAVVEGFRKFGNKFADHLIGGIIGWLTGAFAGGIQMPEKFDFWGILDIARQILGLTLDMMRRVAVRILGQAAVAKIEFFIGYAAELITGGWGGLFDKIKEDLTGLAQEVIGGITTFLTERLIKAGVVWLASLINPAGALLKIIMMIWDFILWMKDNFMRIVQVVHTVVDGMVQIANGNIEPAAKAIEKVLAGLLPPTIDLIARLIGLGNVAERVKDIIGGIRQKIEDAIVKLIRKVLARFTGRGGTAAAPDANGDLMTPLPISGGGESHTLYMTEQGNDVIPMMRSTPVAIQEWLTRLKEKPGVRRQLEHAADQGAVVSDQKVTKTTGDIRADVDGALGAEDRVDQEGEQADDALDNGAPNAAAEAAQVDAAAARLKPFMERILVALGLSNGGQAFKDKFSTQIQGLSTRVQSGLNSSINRSINEDTAKSLAYTQIAWSQVAQTLGTDTAILTDAFKRPLHSTGIFGDNDAVKDALYAKAVKLSTETDGLTAIILNTPNAKETFHRRALLPQAVGQDSTQILVEHALKNSSPDTIANSFSSQLINAVRAYIPMTAVDEDKAYKEAVKADAFRPGGLFWRSDTFKTSFKLKYYGDKEQEGDSSDEGLLFFLTTGKSARAQKNITYTAEMVRAAAPGQHEWILSSTVNTAFNATISSFNSDPNKIGSIVKYIAFQHFVRTDTGDIVFDRNWSEYNVSTMSSVSEVEFDDLRAIVRPLEENRDLPAAEKASIQAQLRTKYAAITQQDYIPYQAHAGGVFVYRFREKSDGSYEFSPVSSQASSSVWHQKLRESNAAILGRSSLSENVLNDLGTSIKDYFKTTSVDKDDAIPSGDAFAFHKFSSRGTIPFLGIEEIDDVRQLRANREYQSEFRNKTEFFHEARRRFDLAYADLSEDIANFERVAGEIPG
ncbi:hypothetical protein N9W89_07715 [Hellea sp.]|nr:hypothetical protein [Hellea sp.]